MDSILLKFETHLIYLFLFLCCTSFHLVNLTISFGWFKPLIESEALGWNIGSSKFTLWSYEVNQVFCGQDYIRSAVPLICMAAMLQLRFFFQGTCLTTQQVLVANEITYCIHPRLVTNPQRLLVYHYYGWVCKLVCTLVWKLSQLALLINLVTSSYEITFSVRVMKHQSVKEHCM